MKHAPSEVNASLSLGKRTPVWNTVKELYAKTGWREAGHRMFGLGKDARAKNKCRCTQLPGIIGRVSSTGTQCESISFQWNYRALVDEQSSFGLLSFLSRQWHMGFTLKAHCVSTRCAGSRNQGLS